MDNLQRCRIVYQTETGGEAFENGQPTVHFCLSIANAMYKYKELANEREITSKHIVDSETYKAMLANMLGGIKQIITDDPVDIKLNA